MKVTENYGLPESRSMLVDVVKSGISLQHIALFTLMKNLDIALH
jgi:hypothetical protein